jgi:hypothetical protein
VLAVLVAAVAVPAADAAPSPVRWPPGTWRGVAFLSGGLAGHGGTVTRLNGGVFTIDAVVGTDSSVTGTWTLAPTVEHASFSTLGGAADGDLTVTGNGILAGSDTDIVVTGTLTVQGDVTVSSPQLGVVTLPVDEAEPADGSFALTASTCSRVDADLAATGRFAQTAAGFATSVTAPFVGTKVTAATSADWANQLADLENRIQGWLTATADGDITPVTVESLLVLLGDIRSFNDYMITLAPCEDVPADLAKGMIADTIFTKLVAKLAYAVASDADQFDPTVLAAVTFAAVEVGAIGTASADPQTAQNLDGTLHDAVAAKLDSAIAAGDETGITQLTLAAEQAGWADLAAKGKAARP